MQSKQTLAAFSRPSQVVLGTTDFAYSQPERSASEASQQQSPSNNVCYLAGSETRDSIIVQASFDQLCVLSRDQRFDQALPFWDAFSGSHGTDRCVTCIAVGLSAGQDQIMLAAAMDHRIAVWSAPASSSSSSRRWKVHSTLTINESLVTTLDVVNGQLLAGTTASLALWRLDTFDIPIWTRFWTKTVPAAISLAKFSPDATSIAAVAQHGQNVLLWQYQPRASKPPVLSQRLYHARPVTSILWRQPPEQNSQADVLISYATDGVARIWAPVIDEPSQLRLWCSVESPRSHTSGLSSTSNQVPTAFYLDPYVTCAALRTNVSILQREIQMSELGVGTSTEMNAHTLELEMDLKRTRLRRLEQLANETPDMFVSFEHDGHLCLTAVANIDRRPPTLLQALTVLRVPFTLPKSTGGIRAVKALPLHVAPDSSSAASMITLHVQFDHGSSSTYSINPATFFDGRGSGIEPDICHPCGPPAAPGSLAKRAHRHTGCIERLCRSGDGKTLVSSSAKEIITWSSDASPSRPQGQIHYKDAQRPASLIAASWDSSLTACLLSDGTGELWRGSDGSKVQFEIKEDVQHLAFVQLGRVDALTAVDSTGSIHSLEVESRNAVRLSPPTTSRLATQSGSARHLISVDSISGSSGQPGDDFTLVTTDASGQVEVWKPTGNSSNELHLDLVTSLRPSAGSPQLVRCSASGLVAVVHHDEHDSQVLVIYNSKTTSFSSGEEHRQTFGSRDRIIALDWSPSPLSNNALAVVFEHHVDVMAPGRASTFDSKSANGRSRWEQLARLDLLSCTPSSIRAACWLSSEQLVVASGAVLFVYGPFVQSSLSNGIGSERMHLAELVAEVGGPVVQYHPAFLLQCALWGKMGLAKAIISNLDKAAFACNAQDVLETWAFEQVPLDILLKDDAKADEARPRAPQRHGVQRSIFDEPDLSGDLADTDPFSSERIEKLVVQLKQVRPPHLSDSDLHMLVNLIKTIGEAVREHGSMDPSGLRYMFALRQTLNGSDPVKDAQATPVAELSYRDFLWAFHSDNQETLLSAVESSYRNKLDWPVARSTGLFAWLKSPQALRTQAEAVARAQFMTGEDRDPVKCSLLYSALGKRKVVQGLWRQAVWHPEQKKMLQFLSHDFDEERWKTAACKNAFALLSQRRYEFAASFFMLGESLRDAVNVCVRNMDDLPLAIALARVKEGCDDGPVFTDLLRTRVLPLAFERGDRWMGSWAFWMLKRRDLAVRIIVTPLRDLLADEGVASLLGSNVTCGNDSYNDPALALLFQQLRSKSLQTIKGLYHIPEKKIFDFVLNTNRALCRMGCHSIGLSLLRNWQFEPPSVSSASTLFHQVSKHDLQILSRVDEAVMAESTDAFAELRLTDTKLPSALEDAISSSPTKLRHRTSQNTMSPPSSPRVIRRRSSLLQRRSSIVNDLDIGAAVHAAATNRLGGKTDSADTVLSKSVSIDTKVSSDVAATLAAEPSHVDHVNEHPEEASTKVEAPPEPKKQGISIFKSATASDSQQGAQEFDFGSFGF